MTKQELKEQVSAEDRAVLETAELPDTMILIRLFGLYLSGAGTHSSEPVCCNKEQHNPL